MSSRSLRVVFRAFKPTLNLIDTKNLDTEARKLIRIHIRAVVKRVSVYPAARAKRPDGGRYIRTHRLEHGWRTTVTRRADTYAGSIYNTTPYATFVQGPFQTLMHKRQGWKQLEKHLHRDQFHRSVKEFVDKRIKR
jgi:hypothetical protein